METVDERPARKKENGISMKVKYSYLEEQFRDYREVFERLGKVIEKGDYTLGSEVREF